MPRVDGFEVLRWIRQQPGLKALRVVVLTCSEDLRDVNRASTLGANSFLVKPLEFEGMLALGKALIRYWLSMSKVPDTFRGATGREFGGP